MARNKLSHLVNSPPPTGAGAYRIQENRSVDSAGGAYSVRSDHLADKEGLTAPSQEPHSRSRPFGPLASVFLASPSPRNMRLGLASPNMTG